jgi:hypothetical protein
VRECQLSAARDKLLPEYPIEAEISVITAPPGMVGARPHDTNINLDYLFCPWKQNRKLQGLPREYLACKRQPDSGLAYVCHSHRDGIAIHVCSSDQ